MDVRALHQKILQGGRSALRHCRSALRHCPSVIARRFGIDPRALAAFRISLGALLLVDLLRRSGDLVAFYTDSGILPRTLLREQFPVFAQFSLHALSGSVWLQALLFVLAGGCALALLLGYRTTTATVVSFVLLVSLHARNPLILNAGDSLLRRLLFWGAFLPLGQRWSVDALRRKSGHSTDAIPSLRKSFAGRNDSPQRRVVSVASAALLIQVVIVYAANAVFKLRGDHWLGGEAIRYALSLDQLTLFLGDVLVQYPLLLSFLDRVWLGLIVASPLLIVLTGTRRAVFAGSIISMHVGMALTMRLGIFPFVSIAGLIPFLPPKFWDATEKFRANRVSRVFGLDAMARRVGRTLSSVELSTLGWKVPSASNSILPLVSNSILPPVSNSILPPVSNSILPPVSNSILPTLAQWKDRGRPVVVAGFLALVLVWNAATLGYAVLPEGASSAVDPEEHRWDMFAPEPRTDDGWYVVPGELSSGERRDVLHESAVNWDRPPDIAQTYPNVRWYKYLVDLQREESDALGHQLAEYLCERWDRNHETDVKRVTVNYVEQPTRLDGPERTEQIELIRHSCLGSTGSE